MLTQKRDESRAAVPDKGTTVITMSTPTSLSRRCALYPFSPDPSNPPGGEALPFGPEEECGIVAIAAPHNVPSRVFTVMRALQHRGQEGAGMVTHDGERAQSQRGDGLVTDVISK